MPVTSRFGGRRGHRAAGTALDAKCSTWGPESRQNELASSLQRDVTVAILNLQHSRRPGPLALAMEQRLDRNNALTKQGLAGHYLEEGGVGAGLP